MKDNLINKLRYRWDYRLLSSFVKLEKLGNFLILLLNNQNRKTQKINSEVIIIIVFVLYFILNIPAIRAPRGVKAMDKPIIVDIATSNLSLLITHWIIVWEYVFKIPISIQPNKNNEKLIILFVIELLLSMLSVPQERAMPSVNVVYKMLSLIFFNIWVLERKAPIKIPSPEALSKIP